jgi:type I restriction enzyme S subunit
VAKIEELMPLVERYGKARQALDQLNESLPARLRQSILQEAIQGRLVPQDPKEEPASELLKRIRKEKEQLVKEGKLKKKDLESKPIEEDEIPFEVPEGWEWCRIEQYTNKVTDFVASGSFATLRDNVKYYKEENYALLVKTKDFQSNFKNDLTYTDERGYAFLSNSNLFGGELILSNVGSIGKIFVVPKLDKKMTLAPNAIMVRFWDENHRDWLLYLFQSEFGLNSLYGISSATAIRKFNKTDFKKLLIPVPPLSEQKRIVAKVEKLFGVIK